MLRARGRDRAHTARTARTRTRAHMHHVPQLIMTPQSPGC